MGTIDDIKHAAEDVGRKLVVDGITAITTYFLGKLFGDKADDTAKERFARAVLNSAAEAAKNEAFLAAGGEEYLRRQLEELGRVTEQIGASVAKAVREGEARGRELWKGTDWRTVCTLTRSTWERIRDDARVRVPAPGEFPDAFEIVGVVGTTPITIGAFPDEVSPEVDAVITERNAW